METRNYRSVLFASILAVCAWLSSSAHSQTDSGCTIGAQTGQTGSCIQYVGLDAGSSDAEQWEAVARIFQLGMGYLESGLFEEAHGIFTNLIDANPEFAEAYYMRGLVFTVRLLFEEAIADLTQAANLGMNTADLYATRAAVHVLNSSPDEAISDCTLAIELDPFAFECFKTRAEVFYNLGRLDEAMADHDRAVDVEPNFAESHFSRGMTLLALERRSEALTAFEQALTINPSYAEATLLQNTIQARKDTSLEEALSTLSGADSVSYDADVYFNRGLEQYLWGNFDLAFQDYDIALAIKPDFSALYEVRGKTYLAMRQFQQAHDEFAQALALDSESAIALAGLVELARIEGDMEEALFHARALTAAHPDGSTAHQILAAILALLGETAASKTAFETAISLYPYDGWIYNDRALSLHISQGDLEAAHIDILKAVELESDEPAFQHTLGYWHYLDGDREEAERLWGYSCQMAYPSTILEWKHHLASLGHYNGALDIVCDHRILAAFRSCAEARCDF